MELLESDDPKSRLLKKSILQRNALGEEAKLISERTEKVITNALIIGGALAATYFVISQFSGGSKKKKRKTRKIKVVAAAAPPQHLAEDEEEIQPHIPGVVTQIGTALASQATAFLLTLAKEKLTEYLERQMQKKTDDHERS